MKPCMTHQEVLKTPEKSRKHCETKRKTWPKEKASSALLREHNRKILETEHKLLPAVPVACGKYDLVYVACKQLGLRQKRCLAIINSSFLAEVGKEFELKSKHYSNSRFKEKQCSLLQSTQHAGRSSKFFHSEWKY